MGGKAEVMDILYSDGYTLKKIAELFGVSVNTVRYHLEKRGVLVHQHRVHGSRCITCENNGIHHTWCMKEVDA